MSHTPDQSALLSSLRQLLQPMARLALSQGLPYAAVDELVRAALVEEARSLHASTAAHGLVSRVSTTTGLSRREATRLLQQDPGTSRQERWLAGEVFTRWLTSPEYQQDGSVRSLPRQGAAPSFESLAQSITRDVHPRSLLEELTRLGLARWDESGDRVELARDAFVPRADRSRMLALLADNVGDHLAGAVENVLGQGNAHFEQAVYADELSPESIAALRPLITACWTEIFNQMVPVLEAAITADAAAGRAQNQRVRVGLYSFSASTDAPSAPAAGAAQS